MNQAEAGHLGGVALLKSRGREFFSEISRKRKRFANSSRPRTDEEVAAVLLKKRKIAENGCWEWTGLRDSLGYGKTHFRGKNMGVHRVAAILWKGFSEDDPRKVLHRCDNPPCFNLDCLWFGTDGDNSRDCTDKKRQFQQRKTHCKNGHPFTTGNTSIKENMGRTGIGYERRCRACHNAQEARRRARKMECA